MGSIHIWVEIEGHIHGGIRLHTSICERRSGACMRIAGPFSSFSIISNRWDPLRNPLY